MTSGQVTRKTGASAKGARGTVRTATALSTVVLAALACSGRPPARPFEPASHESAVGHTVSDLEVNALGSGSAVRLNEFRGKALLINVWASYCAPCKQELPMLDEAAERLRSKNIEIVAISVDESTESARDFLLARPAWSLVFGQDPRGQKLRRLELPSKLPVSYVVDRKGVIRAVYDESDRRDFRTIETQLIELGAAP